ncbi:MAG TPA: phosphatidate cytidylyltransferase [Kofleriaceae bacterium]|nr:phosphatidate cytidylyltransferase [Kofleriaceae bacterium]
MLRELASRTAVAVVALPLVAALLWLGGGFAAALCALAGAIGAYEYYRLTPLHRTAPSWAGIAATTCIAGAPLVVPGRWPLLTVVVLLLASIASWTFLLARGPRGDAPARAGHVLAGIVFAGAGLAALAMLRSRADGLAWTAIVLAAAWSNDTGAFLGGKLLGRHRLLPVVSPGKTWEGLGFGAAAGLMGGLVAAACSPALSTRDGCVVGALAAIVGPVGDLTKSMVKRAAGAKDSGTLFRAHGGMLDRIDAVSYDAIAVAVYVAFVHA